MKLINEILLERRNILRLSLREAAKLIGISHSYLYNLEKGIDPRTGSGIKPTPEILELISKAYGIGYEELMRAAGYLNDNANDENLSTVERFKKILTERIYSDGIVTDDMSDEEIKNIIDRILRTYKIFNPEQESN